MKSLMFRVADCCLGIVAAAVLYAAVAWLAPFPTGERGLGFAWVVYGPVCLLIGSMLAGCLFFRHHSRLLPNLLFFNPGLWGLALFLVLFDWRTGGSVHWDLKFLWASMPYLVIWDCTSAAGIGLGYFIAKKCHTGA